MCVCGGGVAHSQWCRLIKRPPDDRVSRPLRLTFAWGAVDYGHHDHWPLHPWRRYLHHLRQEDTAQDKIRGKIRRDDLLNTSIKGGLLVFRKTNYGNTCNSKCPKCPKSQFGTYWEHSNSIHFLYITVINVLCSTRIMQKCAQFHMYVLHSGSLTVLFTIV